VRVWHLLTQPSGGPADHVADVAPVLAALGHEVTVVMPSGAAASRVEAAGVRRLPLSVASKTDVSGALRFAALLRRERPDVLHCQDRRAGLVGRLAARGAGVPVVFTLHGAPDGLSYLVRGNLRAAPERRRDRLYYLHAERWLARTGGLVVAPSEAIAEYLRRHVRLPAGQVRVVPNGVDLGRFSPAGHTGGAGVLWLGLMGAVKRLDVLLDALASYGGPAVLAGDGPLRAEVAARAAGLGGRVTLPGFVADPVPLLAAADAFVLCSAAENMPLSLLQAMACGLPVVATRVGGVPEVVRDGVEGLLVPPGDAAALAAALASVTPSMGVAARARAEAAYGIDRCAAGLAAVYAEAAS
jgi:glycosyltransferase involved in cell wall biosynthesis